MQTQIVARVAEYIRNPEARKSAARSAGMMSPQDRVVLSSEGKRKYEELAKTQSEWERNRLEHVSNVTQKVQAGEYKMAPEIVDQIALSIVGTL